MDVLDSEAVGVVTGAHRWLIFTIILYLVNYLIAWKYPDSWRISMGRMLIFGVLAFLCLSRVVDLFGTHESLFSQILGFEPPLDWKVVVELRMRIASWFVACCLSLVCIGFGFEHPEKT